MLKLVLDDVKEALDKLDHSDLCDLAKEVEAAHPSGESVFVEMDDALEEDVREKAWKWVLKQLHQANNDPENEEEFKRITKLRHLRYALAHYRFYYADIDQIGGSAADIPA